MADPVLRQIIAFNIARALSWKMLRVVAHVAGDLPCSLSGPVTPSEIAAVPPRSTQGAAWRKPTKLTG
ncbi:MAG: hypothetical protein ACJAVR_001428 [Paracoccaceae bacterium]|jgi:hypothetical protein